MDGAKKLVPSIFLFMKIERHNMCEHNWVLRTDGYEEQCIPAICTKCGMYGCACHAKFYAMSKEKRIEFFAKGIPGNNHQIERASNG